MYNRYFSKIFITIVLLTGFSSSLFSQERREEISVDFKVNSTVIDTSYSHNAERIREIISSLKAITEDKNNTLLEVSFCGSASPEGSYELNRRLAHGRLTALENVIRKHILLPDSLITRNDNYIPWEILKKEISDSEISNKEEILSILDEDASLVEYAADGRKIDHRIVKLQKLSSGKVWQELNRRYFSQMRNACAVIVSFHHKEEVQVSDTTFHVSDLNVEPTVVPVPVQDTVVTIPAVEEPQPVVEPVAQEYRHLYVKTNILGLGLAIANASVELDLCNHLSAALPVYYSAWDYFKTTVKFRTLSAYPELRYWLKRSNDGLFAGLHFGVAYYNYATDGLYRYQDHNRETPSLGGGVSLGYRLPISRNGRWKLELSVGGGVYTRHYDKFHNTPVTEHGLMIESVEDTYYGLDQASLSVAYKFNLKKKGGRR